MTDAAATPTPSAETQQQPPPAAAAPMDAEPTTESFAAQKARIAELEASLARERATLLHFCRQGAREGAGV